VTFLAAWIGCLFLGSDVRAGAVEADDALQVDDHDSIQGVHPPDVVDDGVEQPPVVHQHPLAQAAQDHFAELSCGLSCLSLEQASLAQVLRQRKGG
jgi:hypothetical protein